jgi:hypothetical protein
MEKNIITNISDNLENEEMDEYNFAQVFMEYLLKTRNSKKVSEAELIKYLSSSFSLNSA